MVQTAQLIAAKRYVYLMSRYFDYEKKELKQNYLKELKNLVKNHSDIIINLVAHLYKVIRQENSDRRLAILLICDYFFQRSHAFRLELIKSLQDFLLYTVEIDPFHHPLPPPKDASNTLKLEALKVLKNWHGKFSSAYPKLNFAHDLLRSSKAFDFERADAHLQIEQTRAEEADRRRELLAKRQLEIVMKEMEEKKPDIEKCINETRNAIELLVPKFISEENSDTETAPSGTTGINSDNAALHAYVGVESISVIIPASINTIKLDETNEAIIASLVDSHKLLQFYEEFLSKCAKKLVKCGGREIEKTVKEILQLKTKVSLEIERCKELKLTGLKKRSNESGSDSDEFEDVPEKEGLELDFKEESDEIPKHIVERIKQIDQNNEPCCSKTVRKIRSLPTMSETTGNKNNDNSETVKIPTLSYGLDLKYWGEKDVKPAEIPRNNADCHRFWRPSDESDTTFCDAAEVYQTRLITFAGKEERATRQCRVPLNDGSSLCPRMDKHKCPIHGLIIDRDEMGYPLEQQPECSSKKKEPKEDKEYMKDLEAAVGIDLSYETGKGKRKRKIKKREVPPSLKLRQRLEKKLFNRRTVKRVSATLDAIGKARAAKNFQHQFNYALSN